MCACVEAGRRQFCILSHGSKKRKKKRKKSCPQLKDEACVCVCVRESAKMKETEKMSFGDGGICPGPHRHTHAHTFRHIATLLNSTRGLCGVTKEAGWCVQ